MSATDRPRPLLVVADAGARLVRRGLVAPGDAVRWDGARVVVFRRGPVVCELPAACVDAPSRALYLPRDSQRARADSVSYPGARRFAPRMTLALYNTLTRRVEPFQPLAPPRVTLYTCGPTVWNYAHLGNFRTFLFEDLLRRYLEASGYDVFHIMNLTDVDDRTIKAARAAGTTLRQHTEPFVRAFFEDRDYLRLRPAPPRVAPRVLRHVAARDRDAVRRGDARHPRGRRGPDLPAPRGRDRAVGGGDGAAVRALVAARGVPQRARHQDVEAVRQLPRRARPAGAGGGRGGGPAPVLADALPQAARLHRRSARRGGRGRETFGGVPGAAVGRSRGRGNPKGLPDGRGEGGRAARGAGRRGRGRVPGGARRRPPRPASPRGALPAGACGQPGARCRSGRSRRGAGGARPGDGRARRPAHAARSGARHGALGRSPGRGPGAGP